METIPAARAISNKLRAGLEAALCGASIPHERAMSYRHEICMMTTNFEIDVMKNPTYENFLQCFDRLYTNMQAIGAEQLFIL